MTLFGLYPNPKEVAWDISQPTYVTGQQLTMQCVFAKHNATSYIFLYLNMKFKISGGEKNAVPEETRLTYWFLHGY